MSNPDIIAEITAHLTPEVARGMATINKLCYSLVPKLMCIKFAQETGLSYEWALIKHITVLADINILFLENINDQNTKVLEKILRYKSMVDVIDTAISVACLNQQYQVLKMFIRTGILSNHHIKNAVDMACILDNRELFMILYTVNIILISVLYLLNYATGAAII